MQIRFLHISDIHCGYNNYGVDQMREKLAPQLCKFAADKGQDIQYLFITGDLKFGRLCPDSYPPETLSFVQEIQNTFGITPGNTFVVPGNHDVKRNKIRFTAINSIKTSYMPHVGSIEQEDLDMLDQTRQDYLALYRQICGRDCPGNHFYVDLGGVNLIHLNTALICGGDNEDGSLVVGMSMLRQALQSMDTTKPAIVLAHHSFDCLRQEEQMKLERLLKEKNALLYLCGHKHMNLFQNINTEVKDKDLWEILCGTNMDQSPQQEQTEMSVYLGTLDPNQGSGYIDAYKWSRRNESWMPDSEFSHRECGTMDGRFFFPSQTVYTGTEAAERYLSYLRKTCTDILLDGLPADGQVGSRRFHLDSLYVPARFHHHITAKLPTGDDAAVNASTDPISDPFDINNRIVVLAGPGCGKTTYLKKLITDHVFTPGREAPYPLWVRCRSLNERTDLSIMGILQELPVTAEFPADPCLRQRFVDLVCAKLELGGILLLIDGLDEISDASKRSLFIQQLDTFSRTYPKNRILVTSRYAGYDDYNKSGLSDFTVLAIDDFTDEDIKTLCVNWHHAVINDTEETTTKALNLAQTIIEHDRIKALAKNPLLLTTLLLVQRRVGRLPTKRVALYEESIKVLLETWNQEGHAPMDLDLSICKLAYIAYRMSCRGDQQITREDLLEYLYSAREDISRKLSYDTVSPEDFLKRTEQRSSILVKAGLKQDEDTGVLHEIYEFQHLTFQEYLAAVAVRDKYYPGAGRKDQAIDILNDPNGLNAFDPKHVKKEIVLLTAAMIGWDAEDIGLHLIEMLTGKAAEVDPEKNLADLAVNLLLDEIELEQDTQLDLIRRTSIIAPLSYMNLYKTDFRGVAADTIIENASHIYPFDYLWIAPYWVKSNRHYKEILNKYTDFHNTICRDLQVAWDIHILLISLKYDIIPISMPIFDGLLELLATYYSAAIETLREENTDYARELLLRLEEYHAQHPEIEDFSANHKEPDLTTIQTQQERD